MAASSASWARLFGRADATKAVQQPRQCIWYTPCGSCCGDDFLRESHSWHVTHCLHSRSSLARSCSNATAATRGTCPLPMALSLSTRAATPSATRPTSGSGGHLMVRQPRRFPPRMPPPAPAKRASSFNARPRLLGLGGSSSAPQKCPIHIRAKLFTGNAG